MAYVNYSGLIQVFDYDRCTGLFSNPITLDTMRPSSPLPGYWACEFSANGKIFIYNKRTRYFEFIVVDLLDTNYSITNIWSLNTPQFYIGDIKRGPDDKIYVTGTYFDGFTFPYPYADSVYNQYNMNLGVIHFPDSGAASCNYLPYSFYLGGKRTYWGLPNNPNYDMGAVLGSPCDTLTVGIGDMPTENKVAFQAWYNPAWNLIHVNASQLKGHAGVIRLLDLNGRILVEKKIDTIHGGYYTSEIYMNAFSSGIYFVHLITDKEQVAGKVMK
ncbi:MAG: T9SS type A sorting domain-containing protein [Bacteroidetes bacterium]|nr:T9SS type A sorting domain-containing protein [Bacteroidota bacterium]